MKTRLRSINGALGWFGLIMVVQVGDDGPIWIEVITVRAWNVRPKIGTTS